LKTIVAPRRTTLSAWSKARVHRGDEDAVRSSRVLGDRGAGIGLRGVDRDLGAVAASEFQLGVVDIHGGHAHAHRPCVLHRDVTEPADARDGHPLARSHAGHLQPLVDRDPGAEDRGDLDRVGAVGDPRGVLLIDEHELAEAPVHRVSAVLLRRAQRLPSGAAVLARSARRPQPGIADLLADGERRHAGTERDDLAVAFVSGDEIGLRGDRPIAARRVKVGVADAAGDHAHECLAGAGARDRHVGDDQRLAGRGDHRGAHGRGDRLGRGGSRGVGQSRH
jgi:hypothetical protein